MERGTAIRQTGLLGLHQITQLMELQRKKEAMQLLEVCARAWSRGEAIREKQLLNQIGYASPEAFQAILDAHPARLLHDTIANIGTAFQLLATSRLEIIKIHSQFHALVLHDTADKHSLSSTMEAATKEVYTFSCAAYSLVQAYRHLKSVAPQYDSQLEQLITEIFSNETVAAFVMGLRVNYNHNRLFKANPTYTVTTGETRTVESNLKFDKQLLLQNREWKSAARAFLEKQDNLNVINIVNSYFKLAQNLHQQFQHRLGLQKDELFRDYVRLQQARKTIGDQVWLGILLQSVSKRNIDPYMYLDRYFTAEELTKIMCFDVHSKQQVDFMIALKDPLVLCSSDTRSTLYKTFGVPEDHLAQI